VGTEPVVPPRVAMVVEEVVLQYIVTLPEMRVKVNPIICM
jgi:hypothetical protein